MSIFSWLFSKPEPKNTESNAVKGSMRNNSTAATPDDSTEKRINQRKEPRHDSFFMTMIKHQNQNIMATVVNFSETGLGLVTKEPLHSGDTIELTLALKGAQPVVVPAKIMRCLNIDKEYVVGIQTSISGAKYAPLLRNLNLHGSAYSLS